MDVHPNVGQVLWIRVGALGDLLISTAALAATFQRFPDSKIWVLGDRFWLELLEPARWPRLNGIIIRKKGARGQLYVPSGAKTWKREGEEKRLSYFYRRSQATVNLRIESYRFAWGPGLARVKIRIGSCPWPMKWLYTHWSPWLGKEPMIHERDWYEMVAQAPKRSFFPLGTTEANRNKYATFNERPVRGLPRLKEPNWQTIVKLSEEHPELPPARYQNYWLINPTASRKEKAWPAAKFRELCQRLKPRLEALGKSLVIVGAPNETDWLSQVGGNEFQVIQPPSLGELIDVVAGANVLITNTSSVQFIAAGTGTPSVTLMGRSQPIRWGPVGLQDVVVQGKIPSPPLADLFEEERLSYASIEVDEVLQVLEVFEKVSKKNSSVEKVYTP
ncbi:MAG: glycosyltransferase family 9 protein [Bdellovibrionia bacterium]